MNKLFLSVSIHGSLFTFVSLDAQIFLIITDLGKADQAL
ncbi:Uncharacterized protein dnm_042400 [Desulfonema magnum]|uniref:Uncharacterized protein n=1 Tax=Desulfonema magnum TaxID=45655 RepID=A0A975GNW6_9BACT|nr:Uncharacterized protein dnm_042400 [Desulfonema magnum]